MKNTKETKDVIYRGFRLERVVNATNIGYAPARFNKTKHTITPRSRKVSGWYVHFPDGSSSWADTLKDAKKRVDDYLGEES